ncbi:T9SS type A sorting domain-containing protein [Paludibacter sp.]|uniref:T9SS type A sorting domain-containing protein n=1 Tax=Paludibacter sp. TaxID=1898105 RepID=UPI00135613DD|nr:T9SS type A sorting domain-containing protein [Paludibacter sp.]MTK53884.1 T9SS type A sorting domain-containing protein [Paludibacter sp.]
MKKYLLALFFCAISASAFTQIPNTVFLCKYRNLPHAGDSIIKQQMEYVDPGAAGRDITWDFRTVRPVDDAYNLRYKAITSDTLQLMGIEHRTIYRYQVKGDILLHTGFENATTLMEYSQPEIKMKFPFHYGDTISSRFAGTGEYCHRLPLHVAGITTTLADGSGTLFTPDGKEYKKILRVKNLREYSETGVDSVTMRLETWSWYVKGNRYPIFETVKTATHKTGKEETEHKVTSFFYPPMQQGQQTDTTGLAEKESELGNLPAIDRIFTNCKLLPNPVESQLRIEYDLAQNATINFSLHDAIGVPKITTSPKQQQVGHYTENISMSGFSRGVYPLYVTVNGMVKTLHVVKK